MYECLNCGKIFRDEYALCVPGDTFEYWGVSRTETETACPFCNSTDITDAEGEEAESRCERPYTYADYCEDFRE